MARVGVHVLFAVVLFLDGASVTTAETAQEIARSAFASTVLLVAVDEDGEPISQGSGFFVRGSDVASNYHVIEAAAEVYVKPLGRDEIHYVEDIVAIDTDWDLVVLKTSATGSRVLPLGSSVAVSVGDTVYAVGNPHGLEGTFSQGIVSSIREFDSGRLLQITAPISEGSSGGPVISARGEVIGISVGQLDNGQNLNFAIPAEYLRNLLLESEDEERLPLSGNYGEFTYDDGSTYAGEFEDGRVHGQGTYTFSDGTKYRGAFADGNFHGEGRLTWPSGAVYEGAFQGGQMDGMGKLSWPSGAVYQGNFTAGRINGSGTLSWPDGLSYSGIFVTEQIEGTGMLTFADGTLYIGETHDGRIAGTGTMVWTSGDSYVGQFSDGEPHGTGTYYWASGSRFEGMYERGLAKAGNYFVTDENGREWRFVASQNADGTWMVDHPPGQ